MSDSRSASNGEGRGKQKGKGRRLRKGQSKGKPKPKPPPRGEINVHRIDLLPRIGINLGSFHQACRNEKTFLERAWKRVEDEIVLFPVLAFVCEFTGEGYASAASKRSKIIACQLRTDRRDLLSSYLVGIGTKIPESACVYLVDEMDYQIPGTAYEDDDPFEPDPSPPNGGKPIPILIRPSGRWGRRGRRIRSGERAA